MLLKRKIITPKLVEPVAEALKDSPVRAKLPQLTKFCMELKNSDPKYHFGIVRQWFEDLFSEFPNPDIHLELAELRIKYELIKRDHDEQKIPLPERYRQNWEASKHYNVEALAPSLRDLIKPVLNSVKKENDMESKKKVVVPAGPVKASGPARPAPAAKETVTQSYIRLFQTNTTAKLTDVTLAAAMIKAHPDKKKYTADDIRGIRGMYNRGKLSGQKGKPAIQCVEVKAPLPLKKK